jgi:hypothetical protein
MATSALLVQRLELVYCWYEGMVNATTGMFEYLYAPETDAFQCLRLLRASRRS